MRILKWTGMFFGGLLALVAIGVLVLLATQKGRWVGQAVVRVLQTDELGGRTLKSAEDVLAYLAEHPERYALALWDVGAEAEGVYHDADRLWPLASTVKILPLALASEELDSGRWDAGEPMPEVEALYLPGTDGNAHMKAKSKLDGGTSTLGNVLTAMIRFSDNAATDAILLRLGHPALAEAAARFGEGGLRAPHPLSGTLLLARAGFDGGSLDEEAWAASSRLIREPGYAATIQSALTHEGPGLTLEQQEALARELDNRGSARAYAKLMEHLFARGEPRFEVARERLSWPMEFEANQRDFVVLATKGGSLPGVLTAAYYAETRTGQKRVLALFLHDLPFATWISLSQSFAHQELERELLLSPNSLERLRALLGPRDGG